MKKSINLVTIWDNAIVKKLESEIIFLWELLKSSVEANESFLNIKTELEGELDEGYKYKVIDAWLSNYVSIL